MTEMTGSVSPRKAGITVGNIFNRRPLDPSIIVADGYGLRIAVERGQLVVSDGIGRHRRERRFSRIERNLQRLVIMGHTGGITLDALQWCTDVGIAVIQVDPHTGRLLLAMGAAGRNDARLRRAQAFAATQPVGLSIARSLLAEKLVGQTAVLRRLGEFRAAQTVDGRRDQLLETHDLNRCAEIESHAANTYFAAWTRRVTPNFATKEQTRVPAHWLTYDGRRSVLDRGRSPRKAATPVNAMLNYAYTLAEAECRIALIAIGLDPGLGILHTDRPGRDSLAMDIIEPIRPLIDQQLLDLLDRKHLQAADFHETRDGTCRVLPPLTHELAETSRSWAFEASRLAEYVAHSLATDSAAPIPVTTPLTGAKHKAANAKRSGRRPRKEAARAKPSARTCRDCGAELPTTARKLCNSCWPVTRSRLAAEAARKGAEASARSRQAGQDPTNTPEASAKRSAALAARKAEQLAWERSCRTPDSYLNIRSVVDGLADVRLSQIQLATGLSASAASRIRSGQLIPHQRHWPALQALSANQVPPDRAT